MSRMDGLLGRGVITADAGSLRLSEHALAAQSHRRPKPGEPACRCSPACRAKAEAALPPERTCPACGELTRPIRERGKLLCPWCETPMAPVVLAPAAPAQPWVPRPPRTEPLAA